ncbi:TadE/TadG family type IV pilus assembly protein [Marinobacter sediminum]|uniref:TadE/TadG family type IV pilus assembly protein n=1 Tax=Marinobacter sediminum TaxID=256323 RepID=UPI0020301520
MINSVRKQRGAAMVEMAITIAIFMMLLFAIIEMAILLHTWSKASEATRAASRYAIVSTPVTDLSGLSCPGGEVSVTCGDASCGTLLETVQGYLPWVDGANVRVTYRCSSTGFSGRPEELAIRQVEVALENVTYELAVPNLIGVEGELTLPDFRSTRTTEDLHTPSVP